MTQRENFLEMLNGGQPEMAPTIMDYQVMCVMATGVTDQPWGGGIDPFGVNWIATAEGAIPEPGKFMFEEIGEWKEHVKFPDIDSLDMEAMAQIDLANADRNEKIICAYSVCGLYERMAAFMGFENTLISLVDDPESCHEFLAAFTQYKIDTIGRMIDLYQPDMVLYYDDIATARALFMSPATWRELFKPYVKRIADYVISRNVIFGIHTCGKCEDILDDYLEIGVRYWSSAQCMNDLPKIMEKYGNRLIVEGGWDSTGSASYIGAPVEDVIAETERCLREYAFYNNFTLFPVLFNENGNALLSQDDRIPVMVETWHKGCYHK